MEEITFSTVITEGKLLSSCLRYIDSLMVISTRPDTTNYCRIGVIVGVGLGTTVPTT